MISRCRWRQLYNKIFSSKFCLNIFSINKLQTNHDAYSHWNTYIICQENIKLIPPNIIWLLSPWISSLLGISRLCLTHCSHQLNPLLLEWRHALICHILFYLCTENCIFIGNWPLHHHMFCTRQNECLRLSFPIRLQLRYNFIAY